MTENIRNAINSNMGTATVRSTVPVLWLSVIFWMVTRFTNLDITLDDLGNAAPVLAVMFGIIYRLLREIERHWPAFGRVIFGRSDEPTYD